MFTADMLDSLAVQAVVALVLALPAAALGARLGLPRLVVPAVVGLLLSSAVLGNLAPDAHRLLVRGGYAEQQAYETQREQLQSALDSFADDITPAGAEEARQSMQAQIEPLRQAVDEAEAERRQLRRDLTWLAATLALLACGAMTRWSAIRPIMTEAALFGLFMLVGAALVATAGAALLGRMTVDPDAPRWLEGLILGCAAGGTPIGLHLLGRFRRDAIDPALDDRPSLAEGATIMVGLIVWVGLSLISAEAPASGVAAQPSLNLTAALATAGLIVAGIVAGFLLNDWPRASRGSPVGDAPRILLAALLGAGAVIVLGVHPAAAAWIVGLTLAPEAADSQHDSEAGERTVAGRAADILIPVTALLIASRVDLAAPSIWLVLVVLIASGDGKALGMMFATRVFGGRSWGAAMRLGAVISAGGVLPMAVALALREAGLIDPALFTALVVGSIVTSALARPVMAMLERSLELDEVADQP